MMPLLYADINVENTIKKVGGTIQMKHHLENLGIIAGSPIRVIHRAQGNVIVDVKNSRIALSQELAKKIMV